MGEPPNLRAAECCYACSWWKCDNIGLGVCGKHDRRTMTADVCDDFTKEDHE